MNEFLKIICIILVILGNIVLFTSIFRFFIPYMFDKYRGTLASWVCGSDKFYTFWVIFACSLFLSAIAIKVVLIL